MDAKESKRGRASREYSACSAATQSINSRARSDTELALSWSSAALAPASASSNMARYAPSSVVMKAATANDWVMTCQATSCAIREFSALRSTWVSYVSSTRLSPLSPDSSTTPSMARTRPRSEEHTSELQSRENLVCRLLLEKKKTAKSKATADSRAMNTQA